MNSLDIISDISNRITELDNKITKTSKAASVAFSYLNTRLDNLPDYKKDISDIDIRVSYLNVITDKNKNDITITNSKIKDIDNTINVINDKISETNNDIDTSYSYITLLDSKVNTITISSIPSIQDSLSTFELKVSEIGDIQEKLNMVEDKLDEFTKLIDTLKEKMDQITFVPQNYLLVSKETPKINKLIDKIKNWFYILFHQKQIREERRLEEERIKAEIEAKRLRKEEEERLKQEEIARKKQQELQKKKDNRKKIQELIKK